MSQTAFVDRFPHPFLVVGEAANDARIGFFTHQAAAGPTPSSFPAETPEDNEIIPLVKGGANPYSDRLIVGRARNCDIVFRNASVSKVHAAIQLIAPDVCEVSDHGSRNGTFVSEERLREGEKVRVRSGELIRFGTVGCAFISASDLIHML